jgi:tRNA(Ile)-lysidine synthase
MDFLDRFKLFSHQHNMLTGSEPLLLAVSGGIDSMVMLHVVKAAALPFAVAHCNFQLRGEESDLDALLVEQTAHELGVPFFIKRFETNAYANINGVSVQMAARALRYAWFTELVAQERFSGVATAHNLNDSVETALLNFVRGTGLAGLTGIQSKGESGVIRPLLFATREEIAAYAKAQQIIWREDSSNASDDYGRNFLRHQIVPQMEALNPNFLRTGERNMQRVRESQENLGFLTRQWLWVETGKLDKLKLMQLPAPRRALRELLKPYGFTEEQSRQLAENLQQTGFELSSDAGWQVLCDRELLLVRNLHAEKGNSPALEQTPLLRIEQDDLMIRLPDGTLLLLMPTEIAAPFPDGTEAILIERGSLQYPLTVRRWVEGDVFQPFGMGGQHQKLQDFFTNQKLSRIEKEQVWLLFNGDGALIWVVGMRLDERFRVEGAKEGLKIAWRRGG